MQKKNYTVFGSIHIVRNMQQKLFKLLLVILALMASCTRLPDYAARNEFDGIKAALDRQSSVSLLIIHGLGGYSDGDPDTLIKKITMTLGVHENGPECVREIEDGCDFYGSLKRQDYCGFYSPYSLRIYVLDWQGSTDRQKSNLQYIDNRYDQHRLRFISKVKKDVVDDDLADALLYASNYRYEMQYPFKQSIRWIQQDAQNDYHNENMVVGFSLGGSMFIDSIDEMLSSGDASDQQYAEQFVQQLSGFFMLSNANPLFQLTEIRPKEKHPYYDNKSCALCVREQQTEFPFDWQWQRTALGRFIQKKRTYTPGFQIVAFSDPNDPLSYIVEDFLIPSECGLKNAFLNEEVRNAKCTFMGLVNPIDAHRGYGQNKRVLELIIFGIENCNCSSMLMEASVR